MTYSKLIDDYILGKLPNDARRQFEMELRVNPKLQREVNLCLELRDSIVDAEVHDLRLKLNVAQHSLHQNKFRFTQIASAVAVAGVVVVFGIYSLFTSSTQSQQVFDTYYRPFQVTAESRDGTTGTPAIISSDLIRLYANNEYTSVIPVLESYLQRYPSDKQAILMLSTAYFQSNRTEIAEKLLRSSANLKNDLLFSETIKWYLALALLKQKKIEDSRSVLNEIYEEKGLYSTRAKEIIDLL